MPYTIFFFYLLIYFFGLVHYLPCEPNLNQISKQTDSSLVVEGTNSTAGSEPKRCVFCAAGFETRAADKDTVLEKCR